MNKKLLNCFTKCDDLGKKFSIAMKKKIPSRIVDERYNTRIIWEMQRIGGGDL